MKPLILTLSLYLSASSLFAQSLERFVIGNAGLSTQNEDLQLSFTAGEAVVSNLSADNLIVSQGFHQAVIEHITTGLEWPVDGDKIIAYPNPVNTILYLDIHSTETVEFSLEMYDINGRQLQLIHPSSENIGRRQDRLDLSSLAPGVYLLTVKTKEAIPAKVFKIQKF